MTIGNSMNQWAGKVALVTGASSGIGVAVAKALCEAGMKVAACARRQDRLDALAEAVTGTSGELRGFRVDLREEAQILDVFGEIRGAWGGVDVVVNNAGLGHLASLVDGETDEWREMLDVNVLALCICTREAIRDMRRRGDTGYVIHISSMAGHRMVPGSSMYSATKFAVRALTEGLRQELRTLNSGIRVTSISPGFVETEFHAGLFRDEEKAREIYSNYKVLDTTDVASLVVYALSTPPHVQLHDLLLRPTRQPL